MGLGDQWDSTTEEPSSNFDPSDPSKAEVPLPGDQPTNEGDAISDNENNSTPSQDGNTVTPSSNDAEETDGNIGNIFLSVVVFVVIFVSFVLIILLIRYLIK